MTCWNHVPAMKSVVINSNYPIIRFQALSHLFALDVLAHSHNSPADFQLDTRAVNRNSNISLGDAKTMYLIFSRRHIYLTLKTPVLYYTAPSSLGSRCVPWLGEGISMSFPNDPVLCCPLPYRVAPVFVRSSLHRLAGLPCRLSCHMVSKW